MKIIVKFKFIVLFAMAALFWQPQQYIIGTTALAESDSKGSTIGGVEVGNLDERELKDAIINAVNEWYAQPIIVTDGGESIQVSSSTFQFDIDGTLNYYEEHYKKSWYAFWTNGTTVHLPLNVEPSQKVKNEISNIKTWDTDATYERVAMNASYLKTSEIEAVVGDWSLLDADRISLSIEAIPKEAQGLKELVNALNETITEPQTVFSLLEKLGDSIQLANSEAVNFIASNVYNAALYINGEILERHSQNKIPSYLKPGIEAKVEASSYEDLKFMNTLSTPIQLKLTIEDQKLKTEVYTSFKDTGVSISVNQDEVIQPRTITRYSEELPIGTTKQLQEGVKGLRVSVYRTVYGVEQLVSRDYYSPVNRILLKSSLQPETENSPASNSSNGSNNDPAYEVDLDGDGFLDGDLSENQQSEEDSLPVGSYYDKGGNIITPTKGGK